MNGQQALIPTRESHEQHQDTNARADGRRHLLWGGCFAVVVLALALFVGSLALDFTNLRQLCMAAATTCLAHGQLTPGDLRRLHELGLSRDFYATYSTVVKSLSALGYLLIAALLFWRRSDDRLALLAAVSLALFPIVFNNGVIDRLPAPWWFPAHVLSVLGFLCLVVLGYLFPDGRFVPGFTRWVAVVALLLWGFDAFFPSASNPFSLSQVCGGLIFLGLIGGVIIVQIYRYRRVSSPVQRQQTRWVVYGVSLGWGGYLVLFTLSLFFPALFLTGSPGNMLKLTAAYGLVLLPPLAIGLAILRFRLWEIDLLINRTLVYGTLTGILALVYVGLVVGISALLSGIISQSSGAALVLSTLSVTGLCQPLRSRLQQVIDRRFFRRKYNAARTLAAFSITLRHEVELDQVSEALLAVVQETMQPAHISLWLRPSAPGRQKEQREHKQATVEPCSQSSSIDVVEVNTSHGAKERCTMETQQALEVASQATTVPTTPAAIRTPDQRVRVFVSSTLDELAPERIAAREAITQLRLTPVFFEAGARPYPPRELYRAYLAQSDIFLGLYWQRYGWVAPDMTISGLEDEYLLSGDKPRLIYLKTPAPEREPGLQGLLDRIRSEESASYQKFSTPEELRERIANDLAELLTERFSRTPGAPTDARLAPLPLPRSQLIGREQELAQVLALLERENVGLVTLTGPGGVGKTRLALQVAAELAPQFAVGATFISLASLTDPQLVVPTVARALGLSASGNEELFEYLRPREVLLVLDNTEQLLATIAPLAAQALEVAPRLKMLVTSREPLRVRDEQILPIQPLALPEPMQVPDVACLAEVPSVALFVERAREANPAFVLTPDNAAAVSELCQRLDGLPLALELAAARLSLLTPSALLSRLEHRLPLLNRGARDLPQRQQTLRNTIAWSYDLLEAGEQQLFRRLAVFVGGFPLEAVQAIGFPDTPDTSPAQVEAEGIALEQLAQLLDKSLVRAQPCTASGDLRFSMLETIREYAGEQLAASGEEAEVQERHTRYFLRLAEEAEPYLYRPAQRDTWLERLDSEEANLQRALAWCEARQDRVKTGLRLAGTLAFAWALCGSLQEGRTWLETLLARSAGSDRSSARGKALYGAGLLAWFAGDFAAAARHEEEALSIARELGDKHVMAYAGLTLGTARIGQRDSEAAHALIAESLGLFREVGDAWGEALVLFTLGSDAYYRGDLATARTQLEESVQRFQAQEDVLYASMALAALQGLVSSRHDQEQASSLYRQSLPLIRQARNPGRIGLFHINMGDLYQQYGEEHQAQASYREGLGLWQEMRPAVEQQHGIVKGLVGLAEVAASQGLTERAGRLFGAAARLLPVTSSYREEMNRRSVAARARLDAVTFEVGWTAGQAMTEEQAVSLALQDT